MSVYDLPFFPIAGGTGDTGKDGVSPTVTVADIEGGHRLTIVDAIGTKTFDIMDGAKGVDGQPGEQGPAGPSGKDGINAIIKGVSATIDSVTGTPSVTVTAEGTESERTFTFAFSGLKGESGQDGAPGAAGSPGEKGDQGEPGIQGEQGVGVSEVDITNDELVITLSDTTVINLGNIKGAKGDKGETGEQGPKGDTGETGPQGEPGPAYVLTEQDKADIVATVLAAIAAQAE